jgi:hypothetical protein
MNLNAALGYINFHEGLARRPKGKPISTNFSLTFIKKKSINDKLLPHGQWVCDKSRRIKRLCIFSSKLLFSEQKFFAKLIKLKQVPRKFIPKKINFKIF